MAQTLPANNARSMLANTFSYIPTSFVRDHMHLHNHLTGDPDVGTALASAAALDKLVEKLGLKTSLSSYNVPKEDLNKIASKAYDATVAKMGWKEICPSAEEMAKQVLEQVY
jgi:alcohol dehydrogenase class IV